MTFHHLRAARPRALAALLTFLAVCAVAPAVRAAAQHDGRLIVLGFDGADGRTARSMMDSGELPHLAALAEEGTFAPLITTVPAESPTAWASLNTGQNPAKTGVPGFMRQEEDRTMPTFGHIDLDVPEPVDQMRGTPLPTWSPAACAAAAGGAVFLTFLIVLAGLLRLRRTLAGILALLLGAAGAVAGFKARQFLPSEIPVVVNRNQAAPFWETAARAGVPSIVLAAAEAFGREPVDGTKVLAGLGVPDANGDIQSFFVYTTDELWFPRSYTDKKADTGSGGLKVRVDEVDGVINGRVYGPPNYWEIDRLERALKDLQEKAQDSSVGYKESIALQDQIEAKKDELARAKETRLTLPLKVEKAGGSATVTLDSESQELAEGQWSDWYHLTFDLNPLLKVKAITRVKIVHMDDPYFELYMDSMQIDPAAPPFWQPITMPASFASELQSLVGTYETIGWACATMPFKDRVLDPKSFMEEIEFTFKTRERMTKAALERNDWRILMSVLSTPDRVQHMMYQFFDPENPMYDASTAAETMEFFGETIPLSETIPAIYRQVDRLVGEIMDEYLGPDDTLLICADHGFQSFRRQVHINNWLYEHGYLVPRSGLKKSSGRLLDAYVDWSKTRAYSLGLGSIYLNRRDGLKNGPVEPGQEKALMQQIRADFLASEDPQTGQRIGREAYILSEIHEGPYLGLEGDMMLGFDNGYRVSWMTGLGGIKLVKGDDGSYVPGSPYEDNDKNWSGGHTSMANEVVAGMFFCNRKVALPSDGVNVLDIAPTALEVVGVDVPPEYDRPPLVFQD